MICPFRCGVRYLYKFVGDKKNKLDTENPNNYLEEAQESVFEECVYNECPFFEGEDFYGNRPTCLRVRGMIEDGD